MDPSMVAALQQAEVKQLVSIASGGGGSGDVITPMLKKVTEQGIQAAAEAEGA